MNPGPTPEERTDMRDQLAKEYPHLSFTVEQQPDGTVLVDAVQAAESRARADHDAGT